MRVGARFQRGSGGGGGGGVYSLVLDGGGVLSEEQVSGAVLEVEDSVDGDVLVVELLRDDFLLDLSDDVEDLRLLVVVSVGSDSEVDLSRVRVGSVEERGSEDRVGGRHGDVREDVLGLALRSAR